MFKFVVLAAIIAIVAAKPSVLHSEPSLIEVREPSIARIGTYVESIPSAISHQRSTIVHSRAPIITPIVAPVIRTSIAAPVVRPWTTEFRTITPEFRTQFLRSDPILKTFAAPSTILKTYAAAPALTYGSAPLLRSW